MCLPSCCPKTALVYPPISRAWHSNGSTRYNIINFPFFRSIFFLIPSIFQYCCILFSMCCPKWHLCRMFTYVKNKQVAEVFKNRNLIQPKAITLYKYLIKEFKRLCRELQWSCLETRSWDSKCSYNCTLICFILATFATWPCWRMKLHLHQRFYHTEPHPVVGSLVLSDRPRFRASKFHSIKINK
jgi:hypothetical protein